MSVKDAVLHVRITNSQKQKIEAEAKKQDVTVPEYVLEALEFYSSFDVHFLEHIYSLAEKVRLPMPIVIEHLLQAYLGSEAANIEIFKNKTRIFQRAFQYDENGLITGNRLSDLAYQQQKKESEALYQKLLEHAESEETEPIMITREEAALLAVG